MYKIKQKPDDFIVKEIPDFDIQEKGKYPIFLLKKINYTTEDAIERIAAHFHIKQKFIGYAGIKDKKAVTEQFISINVLKKKFASLQIKDIELKFMGYNDDPIYLGRLKGNIFIITVRNLKQGDIDRLKEKIKSTLVIPNLFGEQRFSKNNVYIGKLLIKRNFEEATKQILKQRRKIEQLVNEHLEKHPHDVIGAIRKIPLKIRKLYVHAYQSELFNRAAVTYLGKEKRNIKIPIIGFGTEFKNKVVSEIYKDIMVKEDITLRDFIIRGMQELSSTGNMRDVLIELHSFKIVNIDNDELNSNKEKVIVSFNLPKGCYATVVIDYLFCEQSS